MVKRGGSCDELFVEFITDQLAVFCVFQVKPEPRRLSAFMEEEAAAATLIRGGGSALRR